MQMQNQIKLLQIQNATTKKITKGHRYAKNRIKMSCPHILHTFQPLLPSWLLVALGQATINILRQVGWNHLAKLLNILAIDLLGESKRSIDYILVKRKEALRNLVGARVLGV